MCVVKHLLSWVIINLQGFPLFLPFTIPTHSLVGLTNHLFCPFTLSISKEAICLWGQHGGAWGGKLRVWNSGSDIPVQQLFPSSMRLGDDRVFIVFWKTVTFPYKASASLLQELLPCPECLRADSDGRNLEPDERGRAGLPRSPSGKESASQCQRHKGHGFNPWVGKIPWRRKWQPTPLFLPGKFHEQRILVGSSPWGWTSQTQLSLHAQRYDITK